MPRRTKANPDWMSTREAAEFVNDVLGLPGNAFMNTWTESRVRRAVDSGKWQAEGVRCEIMPGGYYVSRTSLAKYLLEKLCSACDRAETKFGQAPELAGVVSEMWARRRAGMEHGGAGEKRPA